MHSSLISKRQLAQALLYKAKKTRSSNGREDLLTWTLLHRAKIDPDTFFDLKKHKYLMGIYQCTAQKIVVQKAGQVGISEYAISRAIYTCDILRGNVFYLMPTVTDVSDFSQLRIGPALESSDYLANLIVDASKDGRRGTDKVTMKRIRNQHIIFRGGKVGKGGEARQLKSVPADFLICDELDEMDTRAKPIALKRLGHSHLKHELDLSTPTFPGVGINELYDKSNQSLWHIPCPHCGHWQTPTIDNLVIEWDEMDRPVEWYGKDEKEAWLGCAKCKKELDRLCDGEWVPTYPDRDVYGFHPTKFFTPFTSMGDIVKALQSTNQTKRKECYNQDLGLPYTPKGSKLSRATILRCRRDYYEGPNTQIGAVVMGVDVGNVLNVTIRASYAENNSRPLLYAGEVATFDQISQLMDRYKVRCLVIDALPETRKCRELQDAHPHQVVWLAYYDLDHKSKDEIVWDSRKKAVHLDRARTLERMFDRFETEINTVYQGIEGTRNYIDQMGNLVRARVKNAKGIEVVRYIKTGPDHFAHAENYCMIASTRMLGWSIGPGG